MSEASAPDPERRLQELLRYPREDLHIEYKTWLTLSDEEHRADLAKAILAIANHGGGYVVLGFVRQSGVLAPAEPRPVDLSLYSQDTVGEIIARYAEPTFQCEVRHVEHPQSSALFPIISIPGGHRVPIRARRSGPNERHIQADKYYIRRPGPASETPRDGREWDELIQRCIRSGREELLESLRQVIEGPSRPSSEDQVSLLDQFVDASFRRWQGLVETQLANETPSRYAHGVWLFAYSFRSQQARGLTEFREDLNEVQGHETGWPPWWVPTKHEIAPYVADGLVECWIKDSTYTDGAHSDFWRATPDVRMFLLRGYQEDSVDELQPGSIFDRTLPIWRVGESLLHAYRLAGKLESPDADVSVRIVWQGLAGRTLASWSTKNRPLHAGWSGGTARQDTVSVNLSVRADSILDALPEIVADLTRPLYEVFDFYQLPTSVLEGELTKMRKGT